MKIKIENKTSHYVAICIVSVLTVSLFALLQYKVILGEDLKVSKFIVPVLVGGIFGILISRILTLSERSLDLTRKIKKERDIIVSKNRNIRSFTNTIVHDLKSPIAAINSLAVLILESDEKFDDKTTEYVELIYKSSSDIIENITLIIDKTRIESDLDEDHLEVGNPYYTIHSAIDKHAISALHKSISVQRLIDKNLPDVEYDKNALDSILSNLLSNAIKHSPINTQVKIYNELLSDRLKITIEDNGSGMTSEEIDNAFAWQDDLEAKPSENDDAEGLRLAIVKQLIEQMGGTVSVKSEGKNKGSSFEFTLKLFDPKIDKEQSA